MKMAHVTGYVSRAAFKLEQIDNKHAILKEGACVIDLGASPGSWSQVVSARVLQRTTKKTIVSSEDIAAPSTIKKRGLLIAVDLKCTFASPTSMRAKLTFVHLQH